MKSDAVLYLAYEYGGHIGRPASEVLNLPVAELYGYVSYQKIKMELIANAD